MLLPMPELLLLMLVVCAASSFYVYAPELAALFGRQRPAGDASRDAGADAAVTVQPALAADLLLVDDSAVARAKLRRLFEGAGYHVHLASDGVEAMALLAQGRYAMMVTDLEMPNMDGVALIHACWRQPSTTRMPIIAVSAHENLRAQFNECRHICGVHRKPWADDILLSHVAALIGTPATGSKPQQLAVGVRGGLARAMR